MILDNHRDILLFQRGDGHVYVQLPPRGGVAAQGPPRQAALPGRPVQEGPWHQRLLQGNEETISEKVGFKCHPGRESLRPAVLLRRRVGLLRLLQTSRRGI